MRNYRDLEVWKHSHKLTLDLYQASRRFPKEEMFGLTSQLRRAAISIGANLAEGCGRRTTPEFSRFGFLTNEFYDQVSKELTRGTKDAFCAAHKRRKPDSGEGAGSERLSTKYQVSQPLSLSC